ncbi:MAG TPA: hypothetical protein VHA37_08605 [Candidatus Saccharimonadales bacterium]|jgi:hypothetical protein|nr:hypothetical protein [Candidatus Saccharimonadales bacterium]
MSDESLPNEIAGRPLTPIEKRLLCFLLKKADIIKSKAWLDALFVKPMRDGGMGSLRILPEYPDQSFGRRASDLRILDKDGVPVVVSLNLDSMGNPFELDVWKVDFSPVIGLDIESISNI